MTDEEFQEFYDSLSVEEQAEFDMRRKHFSEMVDNLGEVSDTIIENIELLEDMEKEADDRTAEANLFLHAEKMEHIKGHDGLVRLCKEYAREADWLRHVLKKRGIEAMQVGVVGIKQSCMYCFDKAKIIFDGLNVNMDEANAILNYWRESARD